MILLQGLESRASRGWSASWVAEPTHSNSSAIWPLIRRVHNAAHLNLCPSHFTRRELRENGIEPVGIWRGGVDTQRFHQKHRSPTMRMRLSGGIPDGPVLLYAGRISPEKQLDSLERVLDAVPHAHLALVGDGPARPDLEREPDAPEPGSGASG